ncbi:MAG: hypothetical protein QW331_00800 [Candidatus Woesearchaeota archaeon]
MKANKLVMFFLVFTLMSTSLSVAVKAQEENIWGSIAEVVTYVDFSKLTGVQKENVLIFAIWLILFIFLKIGMDTLLPEKKSAATLAALSLSVIVGIGMFTLIPKNRIIEVVNKIGAIAWIILGFAPVMAGYRWASDTEGEDTGARLIRGFKWIICGALLGGFVLTIFNIIGVSGAWKGWATIGAFACFFAAFLNIGGVMGRTAKAGETAAKKVRGWLGGGKGETPEKEAEEAKREALRGEQLQAEQKDFEILGEKIIHDEEDIIQSLYRIIDYLKKVRDARLSGDKLTEVSDTIVKYIDNLIYKNRDLQSKTQRLDGMQRIIFRRQKWLERVMRGDLKETISNEDKERLEREFSGGRLIQTWLIKTKKSIDEVKKKEMEFETACNDAKEYLQRKIVDTSNAIEVLEKARKIKIEVLELLSETGRKMKEIQEAEIEIVRRAQLRKREAQQATTQK